MGVTIGFGFSRLSTTLIASCLRTYGLVLAGPERATTDRQTRAVGQAQGFTWAACLSYVLPRGLPVWSFLRKIVMHGNCGLSTAARRCPVCCGRSVWECWSRANGGCAQTLRGHCPFAACSSTVLGFKGSERKLWREDE